MSGFEPHVVHFAGHADEDVLVFDTEADGDDPGEVITKSVFARAMERSTTRPSWSSSTPVTPSDTWTNC